MVFSLSVPAFADSVSRPELSIVSEDPGSVSVLVRSKGTSEFVTAVESDSKRTVTIRNAKTGKEDYLIYNKQSGMVYSSITGKTVDLSNIEVSSRSVSSYSTVYLSYAKIRDTLGDVTTAGSLVGMVMGAVPGAEVPAAIISSISTIVGAADNWVVPKASNHGLKLRVKTEKFYRTRMGRRQVYRIARSVKSVSRY